jgi:hypothetical protein
MESQILCRELRSEKFARTKVGTSFVQKMVYVRPEARVERGHSRRRGAEPDAAGLTLRCANNDDEISCAPASSPKLLLRSG